MVQVCENNHNTNSWWLEQRPYYDSAINKIMTHSTPPEFDWDECATPANINAENNFTPNNYIYFGAYYRDQLSDQVSQWSLIDPDGNIYDEWFDIFRLDDPYSIGPECDECPYEYFNEQDNIAYWVESWRMHSRLLPSDTLSLGNWRIEIEFEGGIYEKEFLVEQTASSEGCTDPEACNYDETATADDGSCEYEVDECGVCGGDNTSCQQLGDINGDGTINVIDIVITADLILNNNYYTVGDVNEDGEMNVIDIVILVDWVLNQGP